MDSKYTIKIGDIVTVNFHNVQYTLCKAEVLSMPYSTGDSWILKDLESNEVHYISEGCTITKKL